MDKARDIGQSAKKAYTRAKSKADIDNDQYDSPAEYAEAELSEIAHDGVEATQKTVRKAGRKIEQKTREQIEKRIDKAEKKLEEKLEKEYEQKGENSSKKKHKSQKERSSSRKQKHRRNELRSDARKQKSSRSTESRTVNSSEQVHTKPAYSEVRTPVKASHTHATPKLASKNTSATVRKAPERTAKGATRTVKTAEQSAKVSTKAASTAAKETAKAAEKAAEAAKVAAERAAEAARAAAQATVRIVQVVAKAIAAAAKAIVEAVKELFALIIEGGWVSVIVIAVICVVALLVCSAFGIFAHEDMTGCKPMSEIVAEISSEYHQRMENDACAVDIGEYDALMVSYVGDGDGDAPENNWNDVIAVFAVYCSTDPDEAMNVIELTDISIDYIRQIFYEMNWYELSTDGKYDEDEEMWVLTVYVHQHSMNYKEAAEHFGFSDYQREILYEMMRPEYCSYYARLLGINVSGGANVDDILAVLPSGIGGDVARAAISKLGAPYVRGARGDDKFDCSGLVCWAINQVDTDLGDRFWGCAADQAYYSYSRGLTVEQSELQPGDLVYWQNTECSGCGRWNEIHHTGIYIGLGMVIEASSSKGRVVIRSLWTSDTYPLFMFARPYS